MLRNQNFLCNFSSFAFKCQALTVAENIVFKEHESFDFIGKSTKTWRYWRALSWDSTRDIDILSFSICMLSSTRFLNHNLLTSENRQISRWVSLIVIEFSFLFSEKLYSWSEDNKLLHSASIIKFLSLNHYCFINFFNYSWFPHWMNCFFWYLRKSLRFNLSEWSQWQKYLLLTKRNYISYSSSHFWIQHLTLPYNWFF